LAIVNAVMFSNNRQAQNELATRGQYIQQSLQLEPLYQSLIKSLADLAAKDNDSQPCASCWLTRHFLQRKSAQPPGTVSDMNEQKQASLFLPVLLIALAVVVWSASRPAS
jgi:hypothetical protein